MNGKWQTWFMSTRKVISRFLRIIGHYLYFPFVGRFLSVEYIIVCLIISLRTTLKFLNGFEVRGVFLDISKAFDKVWHNSLTYKLKQNGVVGDLLDTLTNFLKVRKQRVILNGQYLTWANLEAGVPQGSILGLLLFLIYKNNLPENLVSNPK